MRSDRQWTLEMRDVLLNMMRTFFRRKFGELFYRLVVIDLKPHSKGLIVEMGLLLDPNIDNLKDIETSLEDQVRQIIENKDENNNNNRPGNKHWEDFSSENSAFMLKNMKQRLTGLSMIYIEIFSNIFFKDFVNILKERSGQRIGLWTPICF